MPINCMYWVKEFHEYLLLWSSCELLEWFLIFGFDYLYANTQVQIACKMSRLNDWLMSAQHTISHFFCFSNFSRNWSGIICRIIVIIPQSMKTHFYSILRTACSVYHIRVLETGRMKFYPPRLCKQMEHFSRSLRLIEGLCFFSII